MGLPVVSLLREAVDRRASDIHLVTGLPPLMRIDGAIVATEHEPLEREACKQLLYPVLRENQIEQFEQSLRLCISSFFPDIGHFRITLYSAGACVEAAIRVCPPVIRGISDLGLPEVAFELARARSGLVLITGPTGVGKTTTMAALLDQINRERRARIITVEDPIEYRHQHRKSIVIQQEIGSDSQSFGEALTHILRMDPNVIGVGEMRDLETIATALTAAETGHLVIATLHTPDSVGTVDRVVDVFPATQQPQIVTQLAATLKGVIAQQLIPRLDKDGRVLATEVLIGTMAVRNIIRERRSHQLYNVIQTSAEQDMHLMDDSLSELYEAGIISYDEASSRARDPKAILGESTSTSPPTEESERM
ncbi:MAG: PilT/PilU family type 4a pilus ATPase [Armatimonadetes bacterium]|nr:PilT/PilU family type 4a pilus ATPase [Armatimonadota bacterium]